MDFASTAIGDSTSAVSVRDALRILAIMQLVSIGLGAALLICPILLWTDEPRLRMTRWGRNQHKNPRKTDPINNDEKPSHFKRFKSLFAFKHALVTRVIGSWYPKSISEYSGARGTAQHQMLFLCSTIVGILQVAIGLLLHLNDNNDTDTARMWMLIAGGGCCVGIGLFESPIDWRPSLLPEDELTAVLKGKTEADDIKKAVDTQEKELASVAIAFKKAHKCLLELPRDQVGVPVSGEEKSPALNIFYRKITSGSTPANPQQAEQFPTIILGTPSVDGKDPHVSQQIWVQYESLHHQSLLRVDECILSLLEADHSGVTRKQMELDLVREKDSKMLSRALHVFCTLGFVVFTFVAEVCLNDIATNLRTQSFRLAIVGFSAFFVFLLFTWITGNCVFDEGFGQCCRCLSATWCLPYFICYQTIPGRSRPIKKSCLGLSWCCSTPSNEEDKHQKNVYDLYHSKPCPWTCLCLCMTAPTEELGWMEALSDPSSWRLPCCWNCGPCCHPTPEDQYYRCPCNFRAKTGSSVIGIVFISIELSSMITLVLSVALDALGD